ncbi:hypothetical protein PH586_09095 [Pseudomonas sp. SA3-5]|uniref:DUF551 domain-containing protein n=1 Tax=Pseudomonas aestuarii TaxID=3018340 RepID=A0ABT4XEA3_9PSED|nr:hypothetical protein [Pseudomonas aestuarii]MDA7086533.1 hypothetical protein [Pseudomonas aestuarii]
MQVNQPQGGDAETSTPRYDTIVIRGAKGETVPKEVDGGEVVAWSRGHELAAMDALQELVEDLAAGNCHQPAHLTQGAAEALNLMRRRRAIGWDADEPEQPPADWKTAVARAEATARLVFGAADPDTMQAIDYMAGLMLANEPVAPSKWTHDQPTQPGAYWIRGNLLQADALVQVELVDGVLWSNLHQVNTEKRYEYGFTIQQLSEDFEWLGPLAPMGGR